MVSPPTVEEGPLHLVIVDTSTVPDVVAVRPVPATTKYFAFPIIVAGMVTHRYHALGLAGPTDVVAVHSPADPHSMQRLPSVLETVERFAFGTERVSVCIVAIGPAMATAHML